MSCSTELFTETASVWYDAHRVRTSEDNGRTWSDWQPHPQSWPAQNGYAMEKAPVAWCYDPVSKRTVRWALRYGARIPRPFSMQGASSTQARFG